MYVFMLVLLAITSVSAQKKERERERTIIGTATWYSNSFNGRKTASGEMFSQKKLTCATNKFRIGTWLRVENIATKKFVIVRVNDRMAPHPRKIIDLTRTAAVEIGIIGKGFCKVKIESLGMRKPPESE
jgi:rare lipoprotein A